MTHFFVPPNMPWVQTLPGLVVRFYKVADLDSLSFWAADLNMSFNPLKSVNFRLGPHPVRKFWTWMVLPVHNAKKPGILAFALVQICGGKVTCLNRSFSLPALSIFARSYRTSTVSLHLSLIQRFYIAVVRPKLEYRCAVWCGLPGPFSCREFASRSYNWNRQSYHPQLAVIKPLAGVACCWTSVPVLAPA